MIYLHTKFRVPKYNGSLVIAKKLQSIESSLMAAVFFL
jgi:hypothetical protein